MFTLRVLHSFSYSRIDSSSTVHFGPDLILTILIDGLPDPILQPNFFVHLQDPNTEIVNLAISGFRDYRILGKKALCSYPPRAVKFISLQKPESLIL